MAIPGESVRNETRSGEDRTGEGKVYLLGPPRHGSSRRHPAHSTLGAETVPDPGLTTHWPRDTLPVQLWPTTKRPPRLVCTEGARYSSARMILRRREAHIRAPAARKRSGAR